MLRFLLLPALLSALATKDAAALPPDTPAKTSASSSSDAELRRKIGELVGRLDSPSRNTRATAAKSLLQLGPAILPLLPDERGLPSAAARDALRQIQNRLQRSGALDGLGASHVSLRGVSPLGEALRALTSQTGNEFDIAQLKPSVLSRPVSVDAASRPFWEVCDEIAGQVALSYAERSERGRLKLSASHDVTASRALAVDRKTAFRIAVQSASLRATAAGRRLLRIGWQVRSEPRLRPLFARVAGRDLRASASGAGAIEPLSPDSKLELSMDEGRSALQLGSDFVVPAGLEPKTVDFRGSMRIEMAAGMRPIVFEDIAANRRESKRAGAVTVGLRKVEFLPRAKGGQSARVEISVVYDQGGPAFESYRTWVYHNDVALESKDGRRLAPDPLFSTRQQGDGSVAVEYNFAQVDGSAGDYRFVYVAPTAIVEVPVDFHFTTIPVERAAATEEKP